MRGGWRVGGWWMVCVGGESSGWWPPAEAVWQGISLIPLRSEAPFLRAVKSRCLGELTQERSFKNSLCSCWWELGNARYAHSPGTITSRKAIDTSSLRWSHFAFSAGRANLILYISGELCVCGRALIGDKKKRLRWYECIKCHKQLCCMCSGTESSLWTKAFVLTVKLDVEHWQYEKPHQSPERWMEHNASLFKLAQPFLQLQSTFANAPKPGINSKLHVNAQIKLHLLQHL